MNESSSDRDATQERRASADDSHRGGPWHRDNDYRFECAIEPGGNFVVTKPDARLMNLVGHDYCDQQPTGWWMKFVPIEDVDRCLDAMTALANGRAWQERLRFRTAADETLVFVARANPEREASGRVSIVIELSDITQTAALEMKLTEARTSLNLLLESVAIAMWTTDDALRFTWSSGSALALLGLGENALVGTSLYEAWETRDLSAIPIAAHHEALTGETVGYETEWGGRAWKILVGPSYDQLRRISGVVGVGIDMSTLLKATQDSRPTKTARYSENDALDLGLETIQVGDLTVDPETFLVRRKGRDVQLTVSEFRLLMEFVVRPGRVLSRQVLAERVWGHDFVGNGASVTMAIKRLREKIEDDPTDPTIIQTVRGLGYRLTE